MAQITQFKDHKRHSASSNYQTIERVVDGEIIEYINFDALTPAQQAELFPDTIDDTK
jgi:hypothetical protein